MRVRYLGHSCVEVVGKHHILIDPDFVRSPLPDVEWMCVTHAHPDHLGRAAEVPGAFLVASTEVCEIAVKNGFPADRVHPVKAGDQLDTIQVYPGFSQVGGMAYTLMNLAFRFRLPAPGGVPLSYLISDEADLLHIGDAYQFPIDLHPDIFCLPWRRSPFGTKKYQKTLLSLAERMAAPVILPVHYDLPGTDADPTEISSRVQAKVLTGENWHEF